MPFTRKIEGDGMKRVVLLGLACFALFGCGEKKVTEEMLLGDWECTQNDQKAKWKMEKWNFSGFRRDQKRKIFNYIQNL